MDHRHVVLVVDDDPGALSVTEAILGRKGYSPIAASGPLEALAKSRSFQGAIDLLLADVVMADMDGVTLAELILTERPQTRVLLMSGFVNVQSRLPLLKKPFLIKDLIEQVSMVMQGPQISSCDLSEDKKFWQAEIQGRFNQRPRWIASWKHREIFRRSLMRYLRVSPAQMVDLLIRRLARETKKAFETNQTALKKLDHSEAPNPNGGRGKY
jgi:CheY-like chemotaxis protein